MDILAARKKAAERAKAAKLEKQAVEQEPVQPIATPVREEQQAPGPQSTGTRPDADAHSSILSGPDPGFPPIPDVSFVPDEPVIDPDKGATGARQAEVPQAVKKSSEPAPEPGAEPASTPVQEQDLEMLSFLLGSEEYVVEVDRVREVLTPREITPVPHTEKYFLGVCSLRGTVMPIIDLNLRLGLAASTRDEKSRIIVVSLGQDDQVGLFVDRVRGVVRFMQSSVQPAPENVEQGAGAEFLKGIARKNDRLYILLDVEKAAGA